MVAQDIADPDRSGWVRSRWLAEKIASGELPAASCDLMRRCDLHFVGQDRLEDHVEVLAGCLVVATGAGGEPEVRSADLEVYLRRLLSLREMWSRERS